MLPHAGRWEVCQQQGRALYSLAVPRQQALHVQQPEPVTGGRDAGHARLGAAKVSLGPLKDVREQEMIWGIGEGKKFSHRPACKC